ncbi:MAG: nucleotidyl transferase AbiEii/AbiGii toxin family protein [Clostridiales Family XIII bacterium]|nr:nucleotidyl transferase AbiEii/AbiGii toxin family protein [Clostridiales Family XIII bacterium]
MTSSRPYGSTARRASWTGLRKRWTGTICIGGGCRRGGCAEVRIKIEIDTDPPPDFRTTLRPVHIPYSFMVHCYTLESAYAGKMSAFLYRQWKNRVKGRDWYDFEWYVRRGVAMDLAHFNAREAVRPHLRRPDSGRVSRVAQREDCRHGNRQGQVGAFIFRGRHVEARPLDDGLFFAVRRPDENLVTCGPETIPHRPTRVPLIFSATAPLRGSAQNDNLIVGGLIFSGFSGLRPRWVNSPFHESYSEC